MSDLPALRKQLKIKSGVAKRVLKEHEMYKKELQDQKIKLDKLVAENTEEWDIKNAKRMLLESETMLTDSQGRLAKTVDELRDVVVTAKKEPELASDPDLLKAEEVLEESSA